MRRALFAIALASVLGQPLALNATQGGAREEAPDPGTTRLAGPAASVDMNLDSGRPSIEVMVNGQGPFDFVVDTGASFSVIDQGIAEDLGLEVVGTQILRSPGSAGFEGNRVQVGRLEAGGLTVEKPVLATMDLLGFSGGVIAGVLGRPHFRELLLTFDYPGSQLVVTRGSLERSDSAVVAYDRERNDIRFAVDVLGESVPMVLDTGSPGGFTLPKAMESRFRYRSEPVAGPTIRLVGGEHKTWMAGLAGPIVLGDIRYDEPEVKLGTYSDDFGNIGFEVLRDLRVTLDQAEGLVRFERAAGPARKVSTGGPVLQRRGPARMSGSGGKAQLGVTFRMTPSGFVKQDGGLIVEQVIEGGRADLAGLEPGDIVLAIGGEAVAEIEELMAVAKLVQGPRPLIIDFVRDRERRSISID